MIYTPSTLVRVGILQADLLETARKLDPRFVPYESVFGNTEQCQLLDTGSPIPYMVMISKSIIGIEPSYKYNSTFSVTSYDSAFNQELYKRFCRATGLEYRDPPKFLERVMESVTLQFIETVEEKKK